MFDGLSEGYFFRSSESVEEQLKTKEFTAEELQLSCRYYLDMLKLPNSNSPLELEFEEGWEHPNEWNAHLEELEEELNLSYDIFLSASHRYDFEAMRRSQLAIQAILEELGSLWEKASEREELNSEPLYLELTALAQRCRDEVAMILDEDGDLDSSLRNRVINLQEEAEGIVIRSDRFLSVGHIIDRLSEIYQELLSIHPDEDADSPSWS